MSSLPEKTKYRIIGRLVNQESPKDIAAAEDVAYATVLRFKRTVDEAAANGKLSELLDIDQVMLDEILDAVVKDAPAPLKEEVGAIAAVVSNGKSLSEQLSNELIISAKFINSRIRTMSSSAATPGELTVLVEALCCLQNAFFNKNLTQVNVQNNYGAENGQPYNSFMSDKPQDN